MIEQGIEKRLLADAAVSALIGTRMYPLVLPEQCSYPALTYQLISSPETYTNDGPLGEVRARIQIDAWGKRYAQVKAVSKAVRASLNGFVGTLTDPDETEVLEIECDDASDGFDAPGSLYRCQSDWIVIYVG